LIACVMAPVLGGIDQAFQFIQEYTGVVSPGILAVFLLGLFWKKASNKGAILGVILSIPVALALKFLTVLPWMHQMGLTALITMGIIATISFIEVKDRDEKAISFDGELFKTSSSFNISAFVVCVLCALLYALFW
ncbi:MAG: sodium/glucose cotransporter, partial [Ekhidna sp.]|nr:sodium/glucose cotransporter [Ekhidna sp.]